MKRRWVVHLDYLVQTTERKSLTTRSTKEFRENSREFPNRIFFFFLFLYIDSGNSSSLTERRVPVDRPHPSHPTPDIFRPKVTKHGSKGLIFLRCWRTLRVKYQRVDSTPRSDYWKDRGGVYYGGNIRVYNRHLNYIYTFCFNKVFEMDTKKDVDLSNPVSLDRSSEWNLTVLRIHLGVF